MTYGYDAVNRLASVTDALGTGGALETTTYSYDAVGNLAGYSYPNGNDLRHFREGPDKIGVSGTGTAVNGSSIIRTDYNQVLVNGQPLDHSPCSYILEESHSLRVGEIRTYR